MLTGVSSEFTPGPQAQNCEDCLIRNHVLQCKMMGFTAGVICSGIQGDEGKAFIELRNDISTVDIPVGLPCGITVLAHPGTEIPEEQLLKEV
jgi:hypothetical protein